MSDLPIETRAVCVSCSEIAERATMVEGARWQFRCAGGAACAARRTERFTPCAACKRPDDRRRMLTVGTLPLRWWRGREVFTLKSTDLVCWSQSRCRDGWTEPRDELNEAHDWSSQHRHLFAESVACGCFHCACVYQPSVVEGPAYWSGSADNWIDRGNTALCPRCGIDAVIPSVSGLPVQDPAWLSAMHRRWFGQEEPE